jgi:hypothetical protein
MEIRQKVHPDADVIGDRKAVIKILILMKSRQINIHNPKEILLDLETMLPFKKAKPVFSLQKGKTKTIILRAIKKWTIL